MSRFTWQALMAMVGAQTAHAFGQQAMLVRQGGVTHLKIAGLKNPLDIEVSGSQLLWAPKKGALAIYDSTKGKLSWWTPSSSKLGSTDLTLFDPKWSPDGKAIATVDGSGKLVVLRIDGESASQLILADKVLKGSVSWSPDSTRVAYISGDALMISNIAGGSSHSVLKPKVKPESIAWHPNGEDLYYVNAKGELHCVKPTGTNDKNILGFAARDLEWSSNGRYLLGQTSSGWQVLGLEAKSVEAVSCDATTKPSWTGPQRLVVLQNGVAKKLYVGAHEKDEDVESPSAGYAYWAQMPQVEITGDSLVKTQRREIRKLGRGEMRLEGFIEWADQMAGTAILRVERKTDSEGRELNLSRPVAQSLVIGSMAKKTDGSQTAQLTPGDLLDDDRVTLIVAGERLQDQDLVIRDAWIEGAKFGKAIVPIGDAPRLSESPNIELDVKGNRITRTKVVVPMIFPVAGRTSYEDSFLAPRSGGRQHHGQDIFGSKGTPLVAVFDGTVRLSGDKGLGGYAAYVIGDNGWQAYYAHLNNDHPGTDDDSAGPEFAFAPGLKSGMRVRAGQLIGYLGNSGNAKTTPSHCHFELKDRVSGTIINAYSSLRAARKLEAPEMVENPVGDGRDRYAMTNASRSGSTARSSTRVRQVGSATMSYWPIIKKYGDQYGVDPYLIAAVIETESSGNPRDLSRSGAMGLMQLMPANCQEQHVSDPYDPDQNIRGGTEQLAGYIRRFGNVEDGLRAFNCGPKYVLDGTWRNKQETVNYVPRVMSYYQGLAGAGVAPAGSIQGLGVRPNMTSEAPSQKHSSSPRPYKEPVPVNLSKGIDLEVQDERGMFGKRRAMLMSVRICHGPAQITSAQEDPKLSAELQKLLTQMVRDGRINDQSLQSMREVVNFAGYDGSSIHIFETESQDGFENGWKDRKVERGRYLGFGYFKQGDTHYWAVIVARK